MSLPLNVISNYGTTAGVTTSFVKVPLGWAKNATTGAGAGASPNYSNARQPSNQGLLHRIAGLLTVTAGAPTKITLCAFWDDTPAGAPLIPPTEIALADGPTASTKLFGALVDAYYEIPVPGTTPNSAGDALYCWIKTDTGTVTVNSIEATTLGLGEEE